MVKFKLDHQRYDVPGILVAIQDPEMPLFHISSGYADVQAGRPMSHDMLFRCGLITRSFAAAILLKLVEADQISLDQPLEQLARRHERDRGLLNILVNEYPMLKPLTVRHLLSNTSGLAAFDKTLAYDEIFMKKPRKIWQIENYLDAITGMDASFQRGYRRSQRGRFKDSSSNFILASLVIEAVTGSKTPEMMRALFQEQQLLNTHYLVNGVMPMDLLPQMMHGYLPLSHPYASAFSTSPVLHYNHNRELKAIDVTMAYTINGLCNAASVSNAADLLRWFRRLLGGQVLSQAATQTQLLSTVPLQADFSPSRDFYCLSFYKSLHPDFGDVFWTAGNSLGYGVLLGHFAQKDRSFCIVTNASRYYFSLYTESLVENLLQKIYFPSHF
jgi:CubicO group peptidase (beta-lactamase class C family)